MGKYSIKDIEALSGIKAHTLRIWEQRYGIIVPNRTDTNIRYYDDEQLKFILNLALLNQKGLKISKLAKLPKEAINQKIVELDKDEISEIYYVNSLIGAMIIFDKSKFVETAQNCIDNIGFERFCKDVVFPFLNRVGLLWTSGGLYPAQEHFASDILRRIIFSEIKNIEQTKPTKGKFVLFLPENEWHELSLLISEFILRKAGFEVFYLGASLPIRDVEEFVKTILPKKMLTIFIAKRQNKKMQEDLDRLSEIMKNGQLYVAGRKSLFEKIDSKDNCTFLTELEQLQNLA